MVAERRGRRLTALRCRTEFLKLCHPRKKVVEILKLIFPRFSSLVTFPCTVCDSNISATSVTVRDIKCSYHATDERMRYRSKLTVMNSSQRTNLRTGSPVSESGIYRVAHSEHRLPKEVTLLKDQAFPRCSQCAEPVFYELVRSAPAVSDPRGFTIRLYELPEITDESLAG